MIFAYYLIMRTTQTPLLKSSLPSLVILLIIWAIFYFDVHFKLGLSTLGLRPQNLSGLLGALRTSVRYIEDDHSG